MSDLIPHDCPICRLTLRDVNDVLSYEEYECCTDCQDRFAFRDLVGWISGSRPPESEIEEFRKQLMSRTSYLLR